MLGPGPGALLVAVDAGEVMLVAARALVDELEEVLARDRFRTWVFGGPDRGVRGSCTTTRGAPRGPGRDRPRKPRPDDDYLILIALARAAGIDR